MALKCRSCGAEISEEASVCPKCGDLVVFTSAEERDKKLKELASLLEIEEEEGTVEPKLTEGPSTKYTKKENGMVGFTNGRVNGLSERTGFTDGRRKRAEHRMYGEKRRIVIALSVVLLVIGSGLILYFMLPHPSGKITIDGNFSEWDDVPKTTVSSSANKDSITPVEIATFVDERTVSFYVKVRGNIFSGAPTTMSERITDGCYILIDNDGKPETGYSVLGYGFDYKITVFGEGGNVWCSALYKYENTEDRINWSAWRMIGSLKAANSGSQMEVQINRNTVPVSEDFAAILIMKSWDGLTAEPFLFSKNGIYIEVNLWPATPLLLDDIVEFSKIEFCAKGGDALLNQISFVVLGNARNYTVSLTDGVRVLGSATVGEASAVTINTGGYKLTKNSIVSLGLYGNLSGVLTGCTAGIKLESEKSIEASASALLRRHTLHDRGFIGYYKEIPEMLDIDGGFGEWGKEILQDTVRIANPNVDIKEYSLALGSTLGMYVGVEGTIFNGEVLPEKTPIVGPGGGGQPQPGYITGEDVLRVYLYTSISYTNPDYMVEISGLENEIKRSVFYAHVNGSWIAIQTVNARISQWQVEFEVPNVVKNTFFYVEMEFIDWNRSSTSRLILSPSVDEGFPLMLVIPGFLIATLIAHRKREEQHD